MNEEKENVETKTETKKVNLVPKKVIAEMVFNEETGKVETNIKESVVRKLVKDDVQAGPIAIDKGMRELRKDMTKLIKSPRRNE